MLAIRALAVEDVAAVGTVMIAAVLALQFVNELTVVGSGSAGVADYFLTVGINEARNSCAFIRRHARPPSFAAPVLCVEHFYRRHFDLNGYFLKAR